MDLFYTRFRKPVISVLLTTMLLLQINPILFVNYVSAAEIEVAIVDDNDAGYSATGSSVGISGPVCGAQGYGGDSSYGQANAEFTWSFTPSETGMYKVLAHWTGNTNRSSAAPYTVNFEGGSIVNYVDQRSAATGLNCTPSGFVQLGGTYLFNSGNAYSVTLNGVAGSYVSADAIKFVMVDPAEVTNVSITNLNGSYGVGQTLMLSVDFDEDVTVIGTPRLQLDFVGTDMFAVYNSGASDSDTLVFDYVVASGDETSDLDYVDVNSLDLNGGSIHDSLNNPALLTLPSVGTLSSVRDVKVDGVNPTLDSVAVYNSQIGGGTQDIFGDPMFYNTGRLVVGGTVVKFCADYADNHTLTNVISYLSGVGFVDDADKTPFPTNNHSWSGVAQGIYCSAIDTVNGDGLQIIPLVDGNYEFGFNARDMAGGQTGGTQNNTHVTFPIEVDNTNPIVWISSDISGVPTNSESFTIEATDTNLLKIEWGFSADLTCDSTDTYVAEVTSAVSTNVASEAYNGNYLCAQATDKAGNVSYATGSAMFNIDLSAPEVPELVFPLSSPAVVNAADLIIDWTDETDANGPVTYNYTSAYDASVGTNNQLNGSIAYPATTTGTVSQIDGTGTPEGTYFYQVQACDVFDNCSLWSGPWEVTVDNTNPTLTIVDGAEAGPLMADDFIVDANDTNIDPSTLWYAFVAEVDSCDDTVTFTNSYTDNTAFTISDESHNGMYLCAKAEDMAGNMVFVKDTTPVNIDATAPTVGTVEVLSDFDPYVNGIAFLIRAEVSDSHSGIDSSSCFVTTDFNAGAPETSTWTPGIYLFGRCISGSLFETDGDTLEINVAVSDNAGNLGYGTAITRIADSQDPTFNTFDITPLSGIYTSGSPTLSSTVEDTVSPITECQARYKRVLWSGWIDGTLTPSGLSATCVVNLSGLTHNAVYDFQMRVKDSAGHWENSAPINNLRIDAQMPSADASGFTSDPAINTPSNDNTVWVSWMNAGIDNKSGLDGYSFDFTNAPATPDQVKDLEETDFEATSSALADGTWWFNMSTVDNVGNWTSTAHYGPFLIDTTAPVLLELNSTTSDGTYGPSSLVDVRAVFDEALRSDTSITVTLDNGILVVLDSVSGNEVSGSYTIGATGSLEDSLDLTVATLDMVSAYDLAGNLYSSTVLPAGENLGDNKDLVIDVTAPAVPDLVLPTTSPSYFTTTNLTHIDWTDVTDPAAPVFYNYQSAYDSTVGTNNALTSPIYGPASTGNTSEIPTLGTPQGVYYYQFNACDVVNNCSDWSGPSNVVVDNEKPLMDLTRISPLPTSALSVVFNINTEDVFLAGLDTFEVRITDSVSNAEIFAWVDFNMAGAPSYNDIDTVFGLGTGDYTMHARATDRAGNVSDIDTERFVVDQEAPYIEEEDQLSVEIFREGDAIPTPWYVTGQDNFDLDNLCFDLIYSPIGSTFLGCFEDDGSENTSYSWDIAQLLSDAGFDYWDTSVLHEGQYDIDYYVVDAAGNESERYRVTYIIVNVVPEVELEMDQTITEGDEAHFTGWFSDPSCIQDDGDDYEYELLSEVSSGECDNQEAPDDSDWIVVVDYGDGSSTTFAQSTPGEISIPSHVYTHEGEYEVTLMVCESEAEYGDYDDYVELMAVDFIEEEGDDCYKAIRCRMIDDEPTFGLFTEVLDEEEFFATGYGEGDCGCDVVTVNVTNNAPTVVIETNPGDSTTLQAITMEAVIAGGNAPFTYVWGNGNFAGCAGTAPTVVTPATPGSYTCEVIVEDYDNDQAFATKTVVVNPVIPTDLFPTVVLFGNDPATNNSGTVYVTATTNFAITANLNNLGNPNYNFTFGGICAGSVVNTANSTFVSNVLNLATGNYVCTVTVSDSDSDVAVASVPVVVGSVLGIGDAAPQTPNEEEEETDENILGSDTQVCEERFTLSGAVFDDVNENGTQEEGETGIAGVLVQVYYLFNLDEIIVAEETTSADGSYEFEICPGNYNIRIDRNDIPENYTVLGQSDKSVEVTDDSVENFNFVLGIQESNGNAFNWWILLLIILVIGGGTGVYLYAGRREE